MAKRDRLARDSLIAVLIEREAAKKGASSASGTGEGTDSDDPAATFTRRILDAVAELERSLTAARTRAYSVRILAQAGGPAKMTRHS
jgi:DNA invertase Pin-like site-specific DNA recombinase